MRTKQFDEGYNARLNGATFEDNPYGVTTFPSSKDYWEWNKGWSTAHVDVLAYGIEKPFEENPIFTQGYEAFKQGVPKTNNPHHVLHPSTLLELNNSNQWLSGWYKSELDTKK